MKKGLLKLVLPMVALTSCLTIDQKFDNYRKDLHLVLNNLYSFEQIKSPCEITEKCDISKECFENLIAAVWHRKFIKQSKIVEKEILNNKYGSYNKKNSICHSNNNAHLDSKACFIPRGLLRRDILIINKDGFCTKEMSEYDKKVTQSDLMPLFVHEIFHDFWSNLMPDIQKQEFSIEVKKLSDMVLEAETKQERLNFLNYIGVKDAKEYHFNNYAIMQNHFMFYKKEKFGSEFFSFFAEYAFGNKVIIPKQLRRFYKDFISEKELYKDSVDPYLRRF